MTEAQEKCSLIKGFCMFTHRTRVMFIATCCIVLLSACSGKAYSPISGTTDSTNTPTAKHTAIVSPTPHLTSTVFPSPTPDKAPTRYTAHVVLRGVGRPDDLVFDQQGRVLFSDYYNGTVSRVNANGTVTVLLHGLAGPEGLVVLSDGTLVIAEQRTNRILALPPGAFSPNILRTLPGMPSTAPCKDGVDGIALDPTNNTLIIPDSPTGNVYRMSLDGQSLTLLASGITRPVGAIVDAQGTVYVADECGGALWRITPDGKTTRTGGFGKLDDVVLDTYGNALVIDLAPSIHALIRYNLSTGTRTTLASHGFIEPQGLAIDAHGDIYVSDDYADMIVEYIPG